MEATPDGKDQAFLLKLSDTLRAETGVEAIGNRATQLIARQLGADRVYLVSLNPNDDTVLVTHETRRQDMPPLQGSYRGADFPAAIQEIFERTIVYTDVRTDARLTDMDRLSFAGLGAVGFLAASIRRGSQTMIWAAGALSTQPRSWTASEVALFEDAVERTWAAIERARGEEALRQSEDKYRTLFESMDEGFHMSELLYNEAGQAVDWRYLDVNAVFERQTGLLNAAGQLGSVTTPNTEPYWLEAYDQVIKTGQPLRFENYHAATRRWYSAYASRVGGAGSRLFAVMFDDITDRKVTQEALRESEQQKALLLTLSDRLQTLTRPDLVQEVALQLLGEHLGLSRAYFFRAEADQQGWHHVIESAYQREPGQPSVIGRHSLKPFGSWLFEGLEQGQVVEVANVTEVNGLTPDELSVYQGIGVAAFLNVPLLRYGTYSAGIAVHSPVPRVWKPTELALIRDVALRTWDTIERTKAEEALRASQKRFESIANLVPDLLWDSQPDGSTYWYNQRWLDYTGQRFEEAIGWGWMEAIHPDDREASAKRYSEAVAVGTSLQQEHRIRRHDGAYRWFVVSASPLIDENGQVINMYGAATDIHESKQAEEALRQLEQRNRLAIEAAELATWEWDLVTDQVYWNELHFQLLGMAVESNPLPSEAFMSHLHPDDAEAIKDQLTQAIAQRTLYDAEFRIVREDGVIRWMSGYGRVMVEQNGQPVRVSGVMMDITDRKEAQEALRQSEERQRAILDSAKDYAIFTTDLDQRVTSWNPGAEALFGYSEEEILQQPVDRLYNPEDRQQNIPRQEAQIAIRVGRFDNERWHSRQDGSLFYGSGVVTPLRDETGSLIGLLKVMRDLTVQKRAEEALQEADRRKDEFLAMLAHELRNPMSTIRSGLQILSLTQGKDEMSRSTVDMMNRQTDHLVRMVDDLLDVSRISQGKIELQTQRMNLVDAVRQALEAVSSLYQERGHRLLVNLPRTGIELDGDATRLMQLVSNLLTNAARYTPSGGQVRISLEHIGQEALLQVEDTGIGLRAEHLESIFELFVQGDNSLARSQGGLGLGLTLVKRLTELHGGRVEARSEGLGKGSDFRVWLPTLTVAPTPGPSSDSKPTAPASAPQLLLIDDNADAAFTLSMLLKLKGYQVHTCLNGRQGIQAAEELRPRVILCDIGMPELDGYQTCQLIRQQVWGKDMILIALTGYGQDEDKQLAKEAGFDAHLAKPVDLAVLIKLLNELLQTNRD
ncbi:PAS domain S-box protein [Spirosoma arboris]|nr:PAS domain S-box protein [Spirosoma arboris]